jgi:hypothetical protein
MSSINQQQKVNGLKPLALRLGLLLVPAVPIGINLAVELVDVIELLFYGGRLDAVEFFLGEAGAFGGDGLLVRLLVCRSEEANGKVGSNFGYPCQPSLLAGSGGVDG